jgi:hypothetical protein
MTDANSIHPLGSCSDAEAGCPLKDEDMVILLDSGILLAIYVSDFGDATTPVQHGLALPAPIEPSGLSSTYIWTGCASAH